MSLLGDQTLAPAHATPKMDRAGPGPRGVVLVDHKSFPGAREAWQAKAAEFAPQLAVYAEALRFGGQIGRRAVGSTLRSRGRRTFEPDSSQLNGRAPDTAWQIPMWIPLQVPDANC
jgi:hypothetical protein